MNPLRISDIGDFLIIGKANTLSAQLRELAARHSFINQSEEATPTELSSPTGGAPVPYSPADLQFQDVDQSAPGYVRGLSKAVL